MTLTFPSETTMQTTIERCECECGTITGTPCEATTAEPMLVDWVPMYLRASIEAARSGWSYRRGAGECERLTLHPTCAAQYVAADPEWCRMVG